MWYFVAFQEMDNLGHSIDHRSASDFETDDKGFRFILNVGDYVQIDPFGDKDAPRYDRGVSSRLFRYFGSDCCAINIVIKKTTNDDEWDAVIKD